MWNLRPLAGHHAAYASFLTLFNRLTGEPIYKVEERKVANDN
jgi:hypothetical protein